MRYEEDMIDMYNRVKDRSTVKKAVRLKMELDKYIEMGKPVSHELYGFVEATLWDVIRDADERKGSGCMTKSSDRVRHAKQKVKQEREIYDNNYM